MSDPIEKKRAVLKLPLYFLLARLVLILSLPLEGIQSYGDFWNFFHLAGLGRPFLDIWVEFPPIFPFLSRGVYLLVGGREHAFIYLEAILFSVIQAGSIYFFQRIAERIWGEEKGSQRSVIYALLIVGLFYGWAYFDCLAIFFMLLGLYLVINSHWITSGLVLGLGGLVKWFPILILPAIWKWSERRKALRVIMSAVLVLIIIWGGLYLLSPTYTEASLVSQGAKGSWETVWAILDNNLLTGNFNPLVNRLDPLTASIPSGNPSLISPWITLIIFGGLGLFLIWKSRIQTESQLIAFSGLTLIIFFLWSPGYSPQWAMYLIPLVFLSFKDSRHILFGLVILFINLLEWPILLSRGMFQYLPAIILLRTVVYGLTAVMFADKVIGKRVQLSESKT